MSVKNNIIFTDSYETFMRFKPITSSTYLFSSGDEDRSRLPTHWTAKHRKVSFINIIDNHTSISTEGDMSINISLLNSLGLSKFISSLSGEVLYIDITGMGHGVWASLLRAALNTSKKLYCCYSEPGSYKFSDVPTEGTIFDLSSKIEGIYPLPSFSNLREPRGEVCFIPLLGFEGARLAHILDALEPSPPIIPIIGAPGFKLEYPFYSYWGNKNVFMNNDIWKYVKFTAAYCPFSLYYTLMEIREKYRDSFFKIAPIGTKPHGLGAILYAIYNHAHTEVVYDNPIRKGGRTSGSSRLHVFNISDARLEAHAL